MKVLILAGGESEEKSISTLSGQAVYQAINRLPGWEAIVVDPATQSWRQIDCDIVFPVLHGADGEDGRLQFALEQSGRVFVGSRSEACQLTFDKTACSEALSQRSVLCPAEICVTVDAKRKDWLAEFEHLKSLCHGTNRWVIKPNQQGSSVGISLVEDGSSDFKNQLTAAVQKALQFDARCLIQQFVGGREITVSLLDGEALSAIEICVPSGFYDFHAKYESKQTAYHIVTDEAALKCRDLAKQINHFCGTSGIVRIDFIVDEDGQPWFLELNTIPGMTQRSLVPKSAADGGWSLSELCQRAVHNAIRQSAQDASTS